MKILALEMSSARGSLAWVDSDLEVERNWPNDRKNSGLFFTNLKAVTEEIWSARHHYRGSGTGLVCGGANCHFRGDRFANSAGKARLIGFPSICAIDGGPGEFLVVGDARRKSFFFARISGNELMEEPELFSEEGLHDKLAPLVNDTPIFCSESLPQFSEAAAPLPSGTARPTCSISNPKF